VARNTRVVNQVTSEQPTTGVQHADVTVGGTVVDLGALNDRTSRVLVTIDGANVRATYDGSAPATSPAAGHLFYDGAELDLNRTTALAMKFVEATAATPATLRVTEFE